MTDAFIDFDDEPDDEPRHACWLVRYLDGTCQRVGAWPPLSRSEIIQAYRCINATIPKEKS